MMTETAYLDTDSLLSRGPAVKGICVNVASHLDARYGGIATSLPEFCRATAVGWNSQLLAVCDPAETMSQESGFKLTRLPAGRVRWAFDRELRHAMRDAIAHADIVHIHGIWQEHCLHACAAARRTLRPYVVSAHGMLDTWALQQKHWGKAPYMAMYERRNLASAACLRALTQNEVQDYRRAGMVGSVAVVPNGVTIPPEASAAPLFEKFPELRSRRVVLYLGRLHRKKGIDLLCNAWSRIASRFHDAVLFVAGPDSDGTLFRLQSMTAAAGISNQVIFAGMLPESLKWSALAAAEVFVLPSQSEGFSVSIVEALGMGVPVIISRQCWFPEVAESSCGWMIEPDVNQIADLLTESLSISQAERASRQINARNLVESRYTWSAVGKTMVQVYEWILGGCRPECVEVLH
jgi:glycosyltransferase involved in cell wall biosynthesis